MKSFVFSIAGSIFLASLALAAPRGRVFTGQIMDSMCATAGSHASMWTGKGNPNSPTVRRLCTLKCVKMGGKFVLYNAPTKTTYQLDNQQAPRKFAGQNVKVTGTFDAATKTIHVESIEPAS